MVILRGYVVPFDTSPGDGKTNDGDAGSDSESDDDDGDFENLDYQELTHENYVRSSSSRMKRLQIQLRILEDVGRRHTSVTKRVLGRFDPLFLQPFWMMTVEVKADKGPVFFAESAPSYRPREDDGVGKAVCSLFLKDCKVHEQHSESFLNFIQSSERRFSLKGMQDNLTAFRNSNHAGSEIAYQIEECLRGSGRLTFQLTCKLRIIVF